MKIGESIYLDHQATTPVDPRVLAKMSPFFENHFGNPHSADHILGWTAARAVDEAASSIAGMIGADADEIVFTSGATEANNLALVGLAHGLSEETRSRILVTAIEHKSVLAVTRVLRDRLGFDVMSIPVGSNGVIELSAVEAALDEQVLVVSAMLVNNEIGSIQPIIELSELCASYGALLHCDGAQSPGATDIDQISSAVDLLSLSGHKMYGPKGIGALYVNRAIQDKLQPIIFGGEQQGRLRSGTVPTPLCVGMGAAAELVCGEAGEREREKLNALRTEFVARVLSLDWPINLNGPELQSRHPGNANIRFDGFFAHDILGALQPNLAASTGSACTTGDPEQSHVLSAIGLNQFEAESSIRFSLGRYTTLNDVEEAVAMIDGTLKRLSATGLPQSA